MKSSACHFRLKLAIEEDLCEKLPFL